MDDKLRGAFPVKEIFCDGDKVKLRNVEKGVIGEISLNIYISGSAIKMYDL